VNHRTAIDTTEEWNVKRKYDVDDWGDGFYVRTVETSGENIFFLKIPFSISGTMPKTYSDFVTVTGTLINEETILVKSIKRRD
jgi:hypothetical protein